MVQDNTGDSVRNRIDMIVDRQEAREQAGLVKSVNLAKPKKSGDKKKKLPVILFSVLGVIVVGLIVAIIIVSIPRPDEPEIGDNDNNDNTNTVVDVDYETLSDIMAELRTMSVPDADEYLKVKIAEFRDSEIEFDLRLMRVNIYLNSKQYDTALEIAETIDIDKIDDVDKIDYYSALANIYKGLGDEENYQKYFDLRWDIYLEYYDGGHGG